MPEISPKMTRAKLKKSARKTSRGRGRVGLPGVKTDAKHAQATDKCGYGANRELAKLISKAVRAKKTSDKHGAHFVLCWRSQQGASELEQQGRPFLRLWLRLQRVRSLVTTVSERVP
jgi:hypothetical protein